MNDLLKTISRWPTFVIGFLLGVVLNALKPLAPLMKRPTTAIALIGVLVGVFMFFTFTLRAMLGFSA